MNAFCVFSLCHWYLKQFTVLKRQLTYSLSLPETLILIGVSYSTTSLGWPIVLVTFSHLFTSFLHTLVHGRYSEDIWQLFWRRGTAHTHARSLRRFPPFSVLAAQQPNISLYNVASINLAQSAELCKTMGNKFKV